MIGKITSAGVVPAGYKIVVAKKPRASEIKTLSVNDCILRSIAHCNAPRSKPQILRRQSNAYERGESGISKQYLGGNTFRYNIIGRLRGRVPNI